MVLTLAASEKPLKLSKDKKNITRLPRLHPFKFWFSDLSWPWVLILFTPFSADSNEKLNEMRWKPSTEWLLFRNNEWKHLKYVGLIIQKSLGSNLTSSNQSLRFSRQALSDGNVKRTLYVVTYLILKFLVAALRRVKRNRWNLFYFIQYILNVISTCN